MFWCTSRQMWCYKDYCDGCYPYTFPINQQFNYECSCGGKFMTPSSEETGETKLSDIYEIGNPTVVVAHESKPVLRYKCPFCGRIMEGLK